MSRTARSSDRFRLPDGSLPPLAGGDPSATAEATNDALMPRIRELGASISQARHEASEAWTAFDAKRSELAQAGTPDPESPAFQEAQALSATYEGHAERVRNLEATREALLRMSTVDGPTGAAGVNGPQDGGGSGAGPTFGDGLLPAVRRSAGHLALMSDGYRALQARNAFTQSGRKSIDEILIQSGGGQARDQMAAAMRGGGGMMAALVTGADGTSGGALVRPDRLPGITVPLRTRPLRMLDLITVGQTDSDTVEYVEMTGFTNNAAEVAEATAATGTSGTKPESALALIERAVNVRTIAHWIPATKRSLADAGQLRTLIEGVLELGLDLRLDGQLANGNGVGENLRGIANTPGIGVVTLRKPATTNTLTPESILDTIHRAITVCRLSFFEPSAIGIHPNDWERVRLARSGKAAVPNSGTAGSAAEGEYLMGDPTQAGAERLWGLLPVVSATFAEGRPIVGDYRQAVLWLREATQILASDSHMDFFIRNLVAILAEFRAAFGVLAPTAFCVADLT